MSNSRCLPRGWCWCQPRNHLCDLWLLIMMTLPYTQRWLTVLRKFRIPTSSLWNQQWQQKIQARMWHWGTGQIDQMKICLQHGKKSEVGVRDLLSVVKLANLQCEEEIKRSDLHFPFKLKLKDMALSLRQFWLRCAKLPVMNTPLRLCIKWFFVFRCT